MKHSLLVSALTFITLAGCASSTPDRKLTPALPSEASIEAKQVAAQEGSSRVSEIHFEKGQIESSVKEKEKIDRLVTAATKKGSIRKALLIVWADQEMPAAPGRDLARTEVDLAENRGKALTAYLHGKYPDMRTEIISMAKRSGKLSEFLRTKEARIQDSLAEADVPTAEKRDRTSLSKASRAIVILELKNDDR